jgi:hypothetical protein
VTLPRLEPEFDSRYPLHFIVVERKKEKLFKVVSKEDEAEFETLDLAMAHAKTLAVFVTIKGSEFEIVGMFGVDSVKDGVCPDGIAYDWNKASRIGAPKRVRV